MFEWLDGITRWYRPKEIDALKLPRETATEFRRSADRAIGVWTIGTVVVLAVWAGAWGRLASASLRAVGVDPTSSAYPTAITFIRFFGMAFVWITAFHVLVQFRNRSLWKSLAQAGHPICSRCGYFLGGIDPAAGCPECGQRRLTSQLPGARARTHAGPRPWSPDL